MQAHEKTAVHAKAAAEKLRIASAELDAFARNMAAFDLHAAAQSLAKALTALGNFEGDLTQVRDAARMTSALLKNTQVV